MANKEKNSDQVRQHARMAMGEKVTGMKTGGLKTPPGFSKGAKVSPKKGGK